MRRADRMSLSSVPGRKPPSSLPRIGTPMGKPDFSQRYNVLPDVSAARRLLEEDPDYGGEYVPHVNDLHNARFGAVHQLDPREMGGVPHFDPREMDGIPHFDPREMGGIPRFDPREMGGVSPFDHREMGGISHFDPREMGRIHHFDPREMGGISHFDPREMGGIPHYDPREMGGVSRWDPREMGGVSYLDPREMGGIPPQQSFHGLHATQSAMPYSVPNSGMSYRATKSAVAFGAAHSPMPFGSNIGQSPTRGFAGERRDLGHCNIPIPSADGALTANVGVGRGRDLRLPGKPAALPGITPRSLSPLKSPKKESKKGKKANKIKREKEGGGSIVEHRKLHGMNTNVIPSIRAAETIENNSGSMVDQRNIYGMNTNVIPSIRSAAQIEKSAEFLADQRKLYGANINVIPSIKPATPIENTADCSVDQRKVYGSNTNVIPSIKPARPTEKNDDCSVDQRKAYGANTNVIPSIKPARPSEKSDDYSVDQRKVYGANTNVIPSIKAAVQNEKSADCLVNQRKGYGMNTNVIPAISASVPIENRLASSASHKFLDDGTGAVPMTCIDRTAVTSNVRCQSLYGRNSGVLPGIGSKNDQENTGGMIQRAKSTYSLNGLDMNSDYGHNISDFAEEKEEEEESEYSMNSDLKQELDANVTKDIPDFRLERKLDLSITSLPSESDKQAIVDGFGSAIEEMAATPLNDASLDDKCTSDNENDETDKGDSENGSDTETEEYSKGIEKETKSDEDKEESSNGESSEADTTASSKSVSVEKDETPDADPKLVSDEANVTVNKTDVFTKETNTNESEDFAVNVKESTEDVKIEMGRKTPDVEEECLNTKAPDDCIKAKVVNSSEIVGNPKMDTAPKTKETQLEDASENAYESLKNTMDTAKQNKEVDESADNEEKKVSDIVKEQPKASSSETPISKANVIVVNPESVKRQQRKKRIARENFKLKNESTQDETGNEGHITRHEESNNPAKKVTFANKPEVHLLKTIDVLKKEFRKNGDSTEDSTYDTDEDIDHISDDIFDTDGDTKLGTSGQNIQDQKEQDNKSSDKKDSVSAKANSLQDKQLLVKRNDATNDLKNKSADFIDNISDIIPLEVSDGKDMKYHVNTEVKTNNSADDKVTKDDPIQNNVKFQPETCAKEHITSAGNQSICIHIPLQHGEFEINVKCVSKAKDDKTIHIVNREIMKDGSKSSVNSDIKRGIKRDFKGKPNGERISRVSKNQRASMKPISFSDIMQPYYDSPWQHGVMYANLVKIREKNPYIDIIKLIDDPTSLDADPEICGLRRKRRPSNVRDKRDPTKVLNNRGLTAVADDKGPNRDSVRLDDNLTRKGVDNTYPRRRVIDEKQSGKVVDKDNEKRAANKDTKPRRRVQQDSKMKTHKECSCKVNDSLESRKVNRDKGQGPTINNGGSDGFLLNLTQSEDCFYPKDMVGMDDTYQPYPRPTYIYRDIENTNGKSFESDTADSYAIIRACDKEANVEKPKKTGGIKSFFRKLMCVCRPRVDDE